MDFKNVKTLFFDYDGCIHDSMVIYKPAFEKAYFYLVNKGLAPKRDWSYKEISFFIGINGREMWDKFIPDLDAKTRDICYQMVGDEMLRLIGEGRPRLYDGAIDTLEYLREKGYVLVFLSNCRMAYMNAHNRLFSLDKYFDALVCGEQYNFIPKYEILGLIKKDYSPDMVMIGDRNIDIEVGQKNDIYTIGCKYGFSYEGELKDADVLIGDIREIKDYF